jgi:hypothetical protein
LLNCGSPSYQGYCHQPKPSWGGRRMATSWWTLLTSSHSTSCLTISALARTDRPRCSAHLTGMFGHRSWT